ncbi:hypothetical protein [Bacillus sp. ISTL8]|uniref:hypothetical protein n=1 Tax=Bacillus sp. ISTL8 TaxID=2596896 RepID=UPI00145711E5|nr:hypothetical protein [Bacillus sp. ISTL8]
MTKTTIKTIENNVTFIKKGDKVKKNGDMFVISSMGEQNPSSAFEGRNIVRSEPINSALFGKESTPAYVTPVYASQAIEVYALVSIATGERYYPNHCSLEELVHKISKDGFKKVNEVEIIEKS